jgi:nicotinamide mononucleotide (NMN) deamidase PncC
VETNNRRLQIMGLKARPLKNVGRVSRKVGKYMIINKLGKV